MTNVNVSTKLTASTAAVTAKEMPAVFVPRNTKGHAVAAWWSTVTPQSKAKLMGFISGKWLIDLIRKPGVGASVKT